MLIYKRQKSLDMIILTIYDSTMTGSGDVSSKVMAREMQFEPVRFYLSERNNACSRNSAGWADVHIDPLKLSGNYIDFYRKDSH